MVRDFRAIAKAVGKPKGGEAVLRRMSSKFSSLRKRLARANRDGARVTIATPGGTASSPALRLFTRNSAAAEIVNRLGLRSAWRASNARYGFTTTGVEALRQVQSGWLAFVYPKAVRLADQALHRPERVQAPEDGQGQARAQAAGQHLAVRWTALREGLRGAPDRRDDLTDGRR